MYTLLFICNTNGNKELIGSKDKNSKLNAFEHKCHHRKLRKHLEEH